MHKNDNTPSSSISDGPQDSKGKRPSLAQSSIRRVVSYILEACDSKPDIITNERENRINSNKMVVMDSSITLSPEVINGSSLSNCDVPHPGGPLTTR